MNERRGPIAGLILGCACAVIVACGGSAKKSAMAPQPASSEAMPVAAGPEPSTRQRIDDLAAQITSDLTKLNLAPPPAPATACITPPCPPDRMAAPALPTSDATCKPGPSDTCKESCRLADSICGNAGKICGIAQELGGNDAYANEKCGSATASCSAARERCCGCQL